ncbi:MAG: hypothetical protein J1F12_04000 [Muribaculaceae bacterium]|nr:hypothetical protein [Muribaculaceae bacterium]
MKLKFHLLLISLILLAIIPSCKEDNLGKYDPEIEEETGEPSFQTVEVVYPYETYVGSVSSEMRETLNVALSNISGSINDNTRLIILGSLTEVDQDILETAYNNGVTIAIENPKDEEFESFFINHPHWVGYISQTPIAHALLYSFDKDDCVSMVNRPFDIDFSEIDYDDGIEEEELDPELLKGEIIMPEFEDPAPKYYYYMRPWLKHLAEDEKMELDGAGNTEFDSFSSAQHLNASMDFYLDPVVRKIAASKPDKIENAQVKVDVNLSVHQIHVYEGAAGEGNYYIVYNDTEFNSDKAYKGLFCHRHGGVYVRGVGFYAKELRVNFTLLDNNNNKLDVIFPGVCPPEPDNVNNVTSYSKTSEFNIGGSLSISAGYNKDGPYGELKGEVSAGWSWSRQVSANISDVAVLKNVSGKSAGWKLEFNNTPYFETGHKYWINLGTNNNSRSSQTLRSAWVWYEPDGKDDNNREPAKIKIEVSGEYEAASFISTKADWKTVRKPILSYVKRNDKWKFEEGYDTIISLKKGLETRPVAQIVLKNNFQNSYINRIIVYAFESEKPEKEEEVYNKVSSHAPKSEIEVGYFFSPDLEYRLVFYAKEEGKDTEEIYEYYLSGERSFKLQKGNIKLLNAPNDFKLK